MDNPDYTYDAWLDDLQMHNRGHASTWPFSTGMYAQYFGEPAAHYLTNDAYVAAVNAGDESASVENPTQADAAGGSVYVLAPQTAWDGAPQSMTLAQRIQNTFWTTGDKTAAAIENATGIPSLAEIENFLKKASLVILIVAGLALLIWAAKAKHAASELLK